MDIVETITKDLLGKAQKVTLGGVEYEMRPPTIRTLCGAGYHLTKIGDIANLSDLFEALPHLNDACAALSWFLQEDDKLTDVLMDCKPSEVVSALVSAISMLDIKGFMMLSDLARNVRSLIADTR